MPMPIIVPGTIILLERLFHHFHLSSQYRVGGSKCIRAGLSAVSGRVCIKYSGFWHTAAAGCRVGGGHSSGECLKLDKTWNLEIC